MVDLFPIVTTVWFLLITTALWNKRLIKALDGLVITILGMFILSEGLAFGSTTLTTINTTFNFLLGVVVIMFGIMILYGNMSGE